jgi:hypothetical protein
MFGMVLGDVVMLHPLHLAAKPSHVGVGVDQLSCPLHRPTACNCQTRGHSFLLGATLSHLTQGCEAPRPRYLMEC